MTAALVWRGAVNVWDCDEMGHMNVRFYVGLAMQGLVGLAAELGLPNAFSPTATATLVVRDHHIRFLRECRARAPLHMMAGVVEMGEHDALILQVLYHSATNEPAATLLTRVAHVTAGQMRPFGWNAQTRAAGEALAVDIPPFARPRSLTAEPLAIEAPPQAVVASIGAFSAHECDVFGRLQAGYVIGRISDGAPTLSNVVRDLVAQNAEVAIGAVGGAVLEQQLSYIDWPVAGSRFQILSAVVGTDHRAQTLEHRVTDPGSGMLFATSRLYVATFDLDARKIIPVSETAQRLIREMNGLAV